MYLEKSCLVVPHRVMIKNAETMDAKVHVENAIQEKNVKMVNV